MGVKLDEATRKRLKALGTIRKRSPHWLMKSAILEYLDREETFEAEKREDMKRWEKYQETGEHLTNDEMMAWLDELEG
jgi:predicted transcriptional regulator